MLNFKKLLRSFTYFLHFFFKMYQNVNKIDKKKVFGVTMTFLRIQWQKRYTCIPIVLIFSVDLGFKRMQNNINC